jgi:hypothetical protein
MRHCNSWRICHSRADGNPQRITYSQMDSHLRPMASLRERGNDEGIYKSGMHSNETRLIDDTQARLLIFKIPFHTESEFNTSHISHCKRAFRGCKQSFDLINRGQTECGIRKMKIILHKAAIAIIENRPKAFGKIQNITNKKTSQST